MRELIATLFEPLRAFLAPGTGRRAKPSVLRSACAFLAPKPRRGPEVASFICTDLDTWLAEVARQRRRRAEAFAAALDLPDPSHWLDSLTVGAVAR
ncbi:hypothetical protein [Kitasatospora sp. NPDC088351]|uniref:hypothetical protein n=1 Tax=unclassified Kitasatospora TaxID=2633591 RepID=UPI003435E159